VLQSVELPNQVNYWTKTIAVDANAEHVFLTDSQGLTVLTLAAAPLAIGSATPAVVLASGGTVVKVRGSGFQPQTVVTIGGSAAASNFVDANTLEVTVPPGTVGAAQMIVQNPGGEMYRLDAAVVYE